MGWNPVSMWAAMGITAKPVLLGLLAMTVAIPLLAATALRHPARAQRLRGLLSIAASAPMLGLLGSVMGIINSSMAVVMLEELPVRQLAAGLAEALVSTALTWPSASPRGGCAPRSTPAWGAASFNPASASFPWPHLSRADPGTLSRNPVARQLKTGCSCHRRNPASDGVVEGGGVPRMPAVLITGAGRGFGRTLLDEYLGRGWWVLPLVRDTAVAGTLAMISERFRPIVADVAASGAERAIASVLAALNAPLDLLVNNAGQIFKKRGLDVTEPEDVEALVRVHCVGVLRCVKAALPWLRRAPRPAVVNVSSRFGSLARTEAGEYRGIVSYHVAKAAQNMLTVCLDRELRGEGIRVFAVHPGRLRTSVAAADADTEPEVAARTLADWVEQVDRDAPVGCHDLMRGELIEW